MNSCIYKRVRGRKANIKTFASSIVDRRNPRFIESSHRSNLLLRLRTSSFISLLLFLITDSPRETWLIRGKYLTTHVQTIFGVICIFYFFFLYWHAEKMTVETSSSLDRFETCWIRDTDDSTFDYEIHCDLDRRERCLNSIIRTTKKYRAIGFNGPY